MSDFYTAFQISRALGVTPQAVRNALAKSARPSSIRTAQTGFQETWSWSIDQLPDGIRARLFQLKTSGGYRSIHDLLTGTAGRFEPSVPLEAMTPKEIQEASALRAHLAPILKKSESLSVQEMARQAHLSICSRGDFKMESPRTLRRRIERILSRASFLAEFDRLELYAEEFARPAIESPKAQPPRKECFRLNDVFRGLPPHSADESSQVLIWEAAAEDYQCLAVSSGHKSAKGLVLDTLCASGLPLAASRDALRKKLASVCARKSAGLSGKALLRTDNPAPPGRKVEVLLNEDELQIAKRLFVKTGSVTLSLRMLASMPECRGEVADFILKKRRSKHTISKSLRAQVACIPNAVREYYKSPKLVNREHFLTPRTLTFLDKSGEECPIVPGMLGERDDMSNNFIFWIDWPWGGDPCSDKFGVRIARGQNLLWLDAGSLRFLSSLMLVRLRDSYRADDIWQWVGQTYRDIGMPSIGERWERGIWQANKLQGTPIEAGHTSQEIRLGGVQALGRKIIVSQSPTTKIIENRFRYFQRICNTIPGQIGSKRGEMEKVNQLWTQCREGRRDPRDYFLSYEDAVAQIESKLLYMNAEPVEGAIYNGVPNEIWQREGGDQRMTRLTASQSYLFSRDRHVVTVNKGHALVRKTAPDGSRRAWWFHHPDLWRLDGSRVALFMDDYAAEAGATIVSAEGRNAGEVVGQAILVDGCPQFALGVDMEGRRGSEAALDGLERRKDFSQAVRAEYRALGLTHTIARGTYASDGAGRSRQAEAAPAIDADFRKSKSEQVLAEAELERQASSSQDKLFRGIETGRVSVDVQSPVFSDYMEWRKNQDAQTPEVQSV